MPGGLLRDGVNLGPPHAALPPANPSIPSNGTPNDAGTACNAVSTPTPSAVLVPGPAPSESLAGGGSLTAAVEFGGLGPVSPSAPTDVASPSLVATFGLSSGGSVQLYFPAHAFLSNGTGWWSDSLESSTTVESSGLSFATGNASALSSEKLAVMAAAEYGTLTLEVRWHWALTEPNGTVATGPWSRPTSRADWPSSTPSEFFPAPTVSLLATNGPVETIGSNFSAMLGGYVADRSFFLELEFPSTGSVVQSQGETSPSAATRMTVTIPMLNYDQYLIPGTYLVHIHDGCGAMLLSLSETATYARSATLSVAVSPDSCGAVRFNGSEYGSGAVISVRPSSTPYPFAAPSCPGHPDRTWQFDGGLHMTSGTSLLVSSSGRISVAYS